MMGQILAKLGLTRNDVWLSTLTACGAPSYASEELKAHAAACCKPRLLAELVARPTMPVLALGHFATVALIETPMTKFMELLSTTHELEVAPGDLRPLITTAHPNYILRGAPVANHSPDLMFWNIQFDVMKALALAQGKDIWFHEDIETFGMDEAQAANDAVLDMIDEALFDKTVLSCDLETYVNDSKRHHALQAYMAEIELFGLGTPKRAISVHWRCLTADTRAEIAKALNNPELTWAFHNGLYDRTVLKARGYPMTSPWEDTMLAHHAAFPGMFHRLQTVGGQFYAVNPWKSEYRLEHGIESDTDPEAGRIYNALDTLATARLVAPLKLWVERTKTEKVYKVDRRMSEVATDMHLRGMPVDKEINDELVETFSKALEEAKTEIEALAEKHADKLWRFVAYEQAKTIRKKDPAGLVERAEKRLEEISKLREKGKLVWKLTSAVHLVGLLKAVGVPMVAQTAKGKTSTKKDLLEKINHPLAHQIITFRENQKALSTFVWRLFDRPTDPKNLYGYADGYSRIHPIWRTNLITGRWASEDPIASNMPKGDPRRKRPNLRRQFKAPEDRILVGFDYAQIEARIIGLISGDKWLCDIFKDGKDVHAEFAKSVWPNFDTVEKVQRKLLRDGIKRFEFGAFYGGSPETLWRTIVRDDPTVKLADVIAILRLMMGKMPGVVAWQKNTVLDAKKPPYELVSPLTGRRRCYPTGMVDPNEAINFRVQTTGADIMNDGLSDMMDELAVLDEAFPIIQMHDAVVFECWKEDADAVAKMINKSFTKTYTLYGNTVHFPVEIDIGETWADV
jgi:DNA polymerase I-like protein with 3'-5' exonuclease and polymerase domains